MLINAINNQTSFKALIIPPKEKLSPEQQKIVRDLETVLNKIYPHDKEQRSYVDYFEKVCYSDIVLKNNDKGDAISMYTKNRSDKKSYYLASYSRGQQVNEQSFTEYCDMVQTNEYFAKKTLKGITGLLLVATLAVVGALTHRACINTGKQAVEVVNPVKDSLQKVSKDTLDLTKQLVKK